MKGCDFIKPNVLCVGFAKCGTTTLYDILKQHPDIYLSKIKEPIYYGNVKFLKKGFNWYLKRYYPKSINKRIIMEINPVIGKYVSADKIKSDYGVNAKIIIIIRNPIKRLFSNFKMNLIKGDCFDNKIDNLGDCSVLFDKWVSENFLNNKLQIIDDNIIPKFCKSGDYYNKILDYYNNFGKNNVKVIVFEDFIQNLQKTCEEIYTFLGIEKSDYINYKIHSNDGNRIVKNRFQITMNRFFINNIWPNFIIKRFGFISDRFSSLLNYLVWNVSKLFTKKNNKHDQISITCTRVLQMYYKSMIYKLSDLLNIDFNKKWNINSNLSISKEDLIAFYLKNKYNSQLDNIRHKYVMYSKRKTNNGLLNNMYNNKKIVITIIKDILSYYDETKLCDIIFLNGSFSRCTPTYSSDIDISLVYDDLYRDKIFPVELKINYIISKIMNFRGCDRVHTMMVYTDKISNYKVSVRTDETINYKGDIISYYCRNNYNDLLNDTFNTGRSFNCLNSYLCDTIDNKNYFNEWLHNFEILYYKDSSFIDALKNNYKKVISISDKNNIIKKELNNLIISINKQMSFSIDEIFINDCISISKLKKRYKTNILDKLYKIVLIINYINCNQYLDFYSLVNSIYKTDGIRKTMLLELKIVSRLQIVLDRLGYDLSSHSTDIIKKQTFEKEYYNIYKINYKNDLIKQERKIYEKMINVLNELKEEV